MSCTFEKVNNKWQVYYSLVQRISGMDLIDLLLLKTCLTLHAPKFNTTLSLTLIFATLFLLEGISICLNTHWSVCYFLVQVTGKQGQFFQQSMIQSRPQPPKAINPFDYESEERKIDEWGVGKIQKQESGGTHSEQVRQ